MFRRASIDLARTMGVRGYRKHLIPTLRIMAVRQKEAGEKILPKRCSYLEWDFSRELDALCRRLGIERTEKMRDSFVSQGYADEEEQKLKDLGLPLAPIHSNATMAQEGLVKLREVLKSQLRECYPYLPGQALDFLQQYLVSPDMLVDIASQMGLQPFIFRTGTGQDVSPELLYDAVLALFFAVREPDELCRRFFLVQLCGKDVFDLWNPKDVTHMLNTLLQQQKLPPYEARLIGETGRNTLESLFYVGVYAGGKQLGKGAGSTQAQALDVAVRDALRRAFGVTRDARSPFERMAMQRLGKKITHGLTTASNKGPSYAS
ncbi:39S ribosomal protein L44 [Tropilaelaps mercedesae]|uniref:39S ribosomal protein L44 n=1 Tax=Tropilaelaps mercedesae TaxID=418985 RepID=A0A1V9XM99_9ACAR|nr:39S ribosomal protein L44 [Tropilaelaps mercedesae]